MDLATSACEVFGEAGVAALCPHWRITQVRPVRDIVTYDLTTPGAALAIGALPALAAGNEHRGLTQQWARAIYEDQPAATKVDGIRYRTAYNDDHALALWDCDNAITVAHDRTGQPLDLPLTHPHIQPRLLAALIPATSPSPTPTKSTAPGAPPRRRTQIDGFRESSVTAARRREIEVFAAARVGAMSCPQVQISMTSGGLTGLLCVLGGVA